MFLHLCYFQPKPLNNLNHAILDLTQVEVDQKKNKKHKKMYENELVPPRCMGCKVVVGIV
jgi:hypothetical protein